MQVDISRLSCRRGFSAVEIAIVLVIAGLLIAGVLVGRSMITTGKLIKLNRDITDLHIMVENFEYQYKFLPGDFPHGFKIFGSGCGTNAIPQMNNMNGCNGNGDGVYGWGWGGNLETFLALEHLYWAEMTPIRYETNSPFVATDGSTIGDSSMWDYYPNKTSVETSFKLGIRAGNPGGIGFYPTVWNTMLRYGFVVGAYPNEVCAPACDGMLRPSEMAAFDAKFDNGIANSGNITTYTGSSNCADGAGVYTHNDSGINSCTILVSYPK